MPYVVDDERLLKRAQQISNSTAESPRTVIMLPLKVSRVVFFSVRFFLKKKKNQVFRRHCDEFGQLFSQSHGHLVLEKDEVHSRSH